ncbi:MAG: anhydro-N-acetylmuramic acid kinase [Ferruginibacter sp.]
MNNSLEKLYSIGSKDARIIIGLMSGTSLDGLDVALCEISGNGTKTKFSLLRFETVNYNADYKEEVRTIFSKENISLEKLCLLNKWIGLQHAAIINDCLHKWKIPKESVDLIASHGQTIYHAPEHLHKNKKFGNGTLQIGDGDHIALNTGIITISDFRQKHIAAGGEGAPLAAYGDFILFAEKEKDTILLNIGGIANFTFLPAGAAFNKIICSDIGPGNTMMDAWMQKHFPGKFFDEDAAIARKGTCSMALLTELKRNTFFDLPFPKTTGPELFNLVYLKNAMIKSNTKHITVADIMATLNQFTAGIIAEAIIKVTKGKKNLKVLVSGGGMHNSLLAENIKKNIKGIMIQSTREKGIDADAKEAILFAILANEAVAGNGNNFGEGSKHYPAITMGKISFPG